MHPHHLIQGHCEQAEGIASALESVLCGGVLDRLTARLMAKRACLLAVPLYRDITSTFPFQVTPTLVTNSTVMDFLNEVTDRAETATPLLSLYREYQRWGVSDGSVSTRDVVSFAQFQQALIEAGYAIGGGVVIGLHMQPHNAQVRE